MSDFSKTTPFYPKNIFGDFIPREFAATLQHLKSGKAPRPDSFCPEHVFHAGAALKSGLCDYLSFCLRQQKIPKVWSTVEY